MKLLFPCNQYYILLATLFLFSSASFSQNNEFKGSYINQQGDTLQGFFIHYRQWNYNPDKVNFITLQTGTQVDLTPLTCRQFHVEHYDTYIAYKGSRLTNPIELNTASTVDNTDSNESITTFLRQFATSDQHKFYVFKDQLRINLFYSNNNDTVITELLQKASIINNSFWQSMTYKQQLKVLFPGENKSEKIDDLSYSEESLALFINRQSGTGKLAKKAKNRNNGFLLLAGISLNSFKFNNIDRSIDYNTKDYPTRIVPVATIGYIISIERNFGKMFFFPQLTIFSFKHSASETYNNSYPVFTNTFQSSPVISLNLNFGYNIINKPNLKLSIEPGAAIILFTKNEQIDKKIYGENNSTTVITAMNHVTALIDIKAMALIMEKYVIWSAYNFPTTVTDLATTSGKLTSIQMGLGYKF